MRARKVPVTVVTGFLGAGKTSLIRHLLENADGRRLALIINEFGDLGIDGEILKSCGNGACGEEDLVELTNGCLCCTVADEFLPTLETLLGRPEPLDHIVIETSGLALPKPLLKAFSWPEVGSRTTVDGVIAVIDGPALADGLLATDRGALARQRADDPSLGHDSPLEELLEDQLGAADLVIISKADLMDAATIARVRDQIRPDIRPSVKMIPASHGRLDPELVLGLDSAAENDLDSRKSHHDALDGDHEHDDFESFSVDLGPVADQETLARRVEAALAMDGVLRVKGIAAVAGKRARLIVQGVGPRHGSYYDRPWGETEERRTRLVVIGLAGLDRRAIEAALKG